MKIVLDIRDVLHAKFLKQIYCVHSFQKVKMLMMLRLSSVAGNWPRRVWRTAARHSQACPAVAPLINVMAGFSNQSLGSHYLFVYNTVCLSVKWSMKLRVKATNSARGAVGQTKPGASRTCV